MASPIQFLRRARPYLTPGFNSNEDDEPQDGQLDTYGGLLGRLSRALQPQEAVQPQMLERMQPASQPAAMNSRSWDTSDTGRRPFMPDTGPTLRAPEGVATRPRVVPPEQVTPLAPFTRPADVAPPTVNRSTMPYQSAVESGVYGDAQPLKNFFPADTLNRTPQTDTGVATDMAAPQPLRPLPDVPDRTLGVGEAERNYLNYLSTHKPHDRNGRLKSLAKGAGEYALEGFINGGVPGAFRGAIGGSILGAAHPGWDEEREQNKEFAAHAGNLQRYDEQADSDAKRQQVAAQTDATQANTEYTRAIKPLLAQSTIDKNAAGIDQTNRRIDELIRQNRSRERLSEQTATNLEKYRDFLREQADKKGLREDDRIELEAKRIEELIANNKADNERAERALKETGRHNRTSEGTAVYNAETSRNRLRVEADNAGLAAELDDLADQALQSARTSTDAGAQQRFSSQALSLKARAAAARSKSRSANNDPIGIR